MLRGHKKERKKQYTDTHPQNKHKLSAVPAALKKKGWIRYRDGVKETFIKKMEKKISNHNTLRCAFRVGVLDVNLISQELCPPSSSLNSSPFNKLNRMDAPRVSVCLLLLNGNCQAGGVKK